MGGLKAIKVECLKIFLSTVYFISLAFSRYNRNQILILSTRSRRLSIGLDILKSGLLESDFDVKIFSYGRDQQGIDLLMKTIRAVRLIATSRVIIIDDHCVPVNSLIYKSKKNVVIQIWHAAGHLKKFGNVISKSRIPHKNYDLVCVSSVEERMHYAEALGVSPDQVVETGSIQLEHIINLEKQLKGKTESKVAFYAPTYRSGGRADLSISLAQSMVKYFEQELPEWQLLISLHPYVMPDRNIEMLTVKDDEFYQKLLTSTILITDYSSLAIDFAATKRSELFFVPDHTSYSENTGFFSDFLSKDSLVFKKMNELISFIANYDFHDDLVGGDYFEKLFSNSKGATKKIMSLIDEIMD